MKYDIVVVSWPGPPCVSWNRMSKTWSEWMIVSTITTSSVVRIPGSVT